MHLQLSSLHTPTHPVHSAQRTADARFSNRIGRAALRALYRELAAYPKPGLVSFVDSGSHIDMDARTFMRSLFALRHYFCAITAAGLSAPAFSELQALGLLAEGRMFKATQGVNTHRGAIFSLGLLAAAAGLLYSTGRPLTSAALGEMVRKQWSKTILDSREASPPSHGGLVARRYGVEGARAEAADGFPHLFQIGLPTLRRILARTGDREAASVHCFFGLMAVVPDTNLLYRGGQKGLILAQEAAQRFLDAGGVEQNDWRRQAISIHRDFIRDNLSPGGSADLLAATLFVHQVTDL